MLISRKIFLGHQQVATYVAKFATKYKMITQQLVCTMYTYTTIRAAM